MAGGHGLQIIPSDDLIWSHHGYGSGFSPDLKSRFEAKAVHRFDKVLAAIGLDSYEMHNILKHLPLRTDMK